MAKLKIPALPAALDRNQVDAALASLGIVGKAIQHVDIGPHLVTVTHYAARQGTCHDVKTYIPIRDGE